MNRKDKSKRIKKRNKKEKMKGITLLSLIITIIILIILAGITLVALSGENGILRQASKAKEETAKAEEKEQEDLKELEQQILLNTEVWNGNVGNSYAGGTGGKEDPYLIENGEQLAYLAEQVNDGETYEGKYFKIVNSINLGGMEWTPIGGDVEAQETFIDINWETTKQFKGALDGQDNIIANINIKKETSGEIGLIGALGDTGVVKNIKISSGNIVGCRWVGAIAGISKGTIENCTNLANIKAIPLENDKTYNSGIFSGGIVGEVDAGTITNCINEGEVIAKIQSSGGIVGGMANGKIENCKNLGNVVVNKSLVNSSGVNAGGIIGYLVNGTIESCINQSKIIAEQNRSGGIVGGMENGTVQYCTNKGDVTSDQQVGGIIGRMNEGTLKTSSNVGYILSKSETGIGVSGGIVGANMKGNIEKVYNNGKVEAKDYPGTDEVGGIIGRNANTSIIKLSYNKGELIGEGYKGGIIGNKSNGTIEKCYYYSDIITKGIGNQDNDVSGETEKVEDNIETYEEFLTWIEGKKE